MKISDKIYIDTNTEPVSGEVFQLLTYENPDYFQKMNMGLSVFGVPKQIHTYTKREDGILEIWRGEALRVRHLIGHHSYHFEHKSHPINLQYINNDFDLDEYQEGAVAKMKEMEQGVVHAVTSAGKSLIILKAIVEKKQRALILVHRKLLMQQLLEDIDKYIRDEKGEKIEVGIIGNGQCRIGHITIGIDKSVSKNLGMVREQFGMVILDECHLCPAKTISDIINSINARFRFGLSGTLKRKDQKEFLIFSAFGQVIFTITKDMLLKKKRIVPVYLKVLESETMFDWNAVVSYYIDRDHNNPTQAARLLREKTIMNDETRNRMILDHVSKLPGKTIVLSRYVDPCLKLQKQLSEEFGLDSGVITGKDSKRGSEAYTGMKEGNLKTIFATIGCVSTGISISELDHIVLISPLYKNELLLHQIRGRLMRKYEGKKHGLLWFVYDKNIFPPRDLRKLQKIIEEE